MNKTADESKKPLVDVKHGHVITTSIDIADNFIKQHTHVLEAIRKVDCSELFSQSNFRLSTYLDDRGKRQPMYEVTRDGFTFLVMGFRGKKAATWKEKYITAFNAMELVLLNHANPAWKQLREMGKKARLNETDTIANFIEYAKKQGSNNADRYYSNLTNATYKALFIIKNKSKQSFRDMLNNMQLSFLQTAEYLAINAIKEGMSMNLHYKDIYKLVKKRITAFAQTTGATEVVSGNQPVKLIRAA